MPQNPTDDQYRAAHADWAAARSEPDLRADAGGTRSVVRFEDVAAVLRDVETFVGSLGNQDALPPDEQILQWIREPRHSKLRRVVNGVIAPHRLEPVGPFITKLAGELLEGIVGRGPVDLIPTLVDPLPTRTIAHVFGIPEDDAIRFGEMSDEFLSRQSNLLNRTIGDVHPEFTGYVEALVASRRAMTARSDDVMTRLIEADIDGELLSDAAIRTQMMMLIIAGNETTRNLLGNMFLTLAQCPDLYRRLRDDHTLADRVIEESLRYDSPVQLLFRKCDRDTQLDQTALAAGDGVMLCVGSANRDERHYDDPDEFSVDRPNARDHLAFGTGPHICPGASLARMEARLALHTFVEKVAAIDLVEDHQPVPNPVFWARGVRTLEVELTPA